MAGAFAALVPILVIGMVVLVIVAIVVGSKRERERREAMRASAASMGLRFTERDDTLDERMAAFPPFAIGHSRVGLNLMEGEATLGGVRMTFLAGDYQYKVTTSNGKSTQTTTYNMSFIAVAPVNIVPSMTGAGKREVRSLYDHSAMPRPASPFSPSWFPSTMKSGIEWHARPK